MKYALFFLIVVVFCTGCQRSVQYETLGGCSPVFDDIYELKCYNCDLAYSLFHSVGDTLDRDGLRHKSEFLFAEYEVLSVELAYMNKCYEGDTLIYDAYRFYDSLLQNKPSLKRNKFIYYQYARACYYAGVTESLDEAFWEQSFDDFLKSLWAMDGLTGKRRIISAQHGDNYDDYEYFTGLIYDRLSWLLYKNNEFDVAIECLNSSIHSFEEVGCLKGIASSTEVMGDIELSRLNRDAALGYYHVSDSLYSLISDTSSYLKFRLLLHQGLYYSKQEDFEAAKNVLFEAADYATTDWTRHYLHFGLGYVYNLEQLYDSALYHYERSYPLMNMQTARSYSSIVQLTNHLGDSLKAARYGELLAGFYFAELAKSGQGTRMVTMYDQYKLTSRMMHNRDLLFFVVALVFLLVICLIINGIIGYHRRLAHQKTVEYHEQVNATLQDAIESAKNESLHKDDKIKALEEELRKRIDNPDFQRLPFEEKLATLYEIPISKRVRTVLDVNVKAGVAYPELVLSDNQKMKLVNAVDAVFPKFSVKIIERYPRLNRGDVEYCCMYILGLSEIQAAALTGKTYQAVWKRSVKMHEIFDNKADLQFILCDILKNWNSAD